MIKDYHKTPRFECQHPFTLYRAEMGFTYIAREIEKNHMYIKCSSDHGSINKWPTFLHIHTQIEDFNKEISRHNK